MGSGEGAKFGLLLGLSVAEWTSGRVGVALARGVDAGSRPGDQPTESYCVPCGCIVRHGGGVCCTSVIRIESASWLRRINLVRFRRRQVTVGLVEALLVHARAALGIHIEVTCQHEGPLFLASFEHGLPPARCKVDRVRGDGGEIARFGMVGAHVLAGGSAATFAAQARHQAAFPVLSRIDRSSATETKAARVPV